jgi:hypothetical protein
MIQRSQAMYMHRIDLMGPEYVLMLGAWWGAAVVLTVLAMAIRQAVARWNARRIAKHHRAEIVSGVGH